MIYLCLWNFTGSEITNVQSALQRDGECRQLDSIVNRELPCSMTFVSDYPHDKGRTIIYKREKMYYSQRTD